MNIFLNVVPAITKEDIIALSNIEGTYVTWREALYNVVEGETRFHERVHGHWHTSPPNPVMMYRWRIKIENTMTVTYRKEVRHAHLWNRIHSVLNPWSKDNKQ
jgi:hypothetical protein